MQLLQRQADGEHLRDHLLAAMAAGAPPDPRLGRQPPPAGLALWQAFCELASTRPSSMGGPMAVPASEIAAWQQLHRVRLTPWEVDTITAMDRAALGVMSVVKTPAQGGGVQ